MISLTRALAGSGGPALLLNFDFIDRLFISNFKFIRPFISSGLPWADLSGIDLFSLVFRFFFCSDWLSALCLLFTSHSQGVERKAD